MNAARARAFADHLLGQDDPYNALTWYRLALFLDPERHDAEAIRFRMAWAYERGERWSAAEVAYGQVGGELAARAAWRIAATNMQAGRNEAADQGFLQIPLYFPGTSWAEMAPFAQGVVYLEAHDLTRAAARFEAVPPDLDPWGPRAVDLARQAREPLHHRPAWLAATMSLLVPGTGQVYAGHVGDGITTFVANGVLGTWSYALIRDGVEADRSWKVGVGTVIGTMCLFTWSSNVVGAWQSAHRFDATQARLQAEALLKQASDPILEMHGRDVALP